MLRHFKRRAPKPGVFCVLLFPDSAENRWFEELPAPGTRLRSSQGGSQWVVDVVLQSGRDTYTVYCVDRREYLDALRNRSDRPTDLPAELLDAARRTSDFVAERNRRRRLRNYLP